ncbi:MAG: hypothetical protein Q3997_00170 [Propionibacteriaceae bacterium]|nr:hypothetical protein [Propionibacteriaceae bacterium]
MSHDWTECFTLDGGRGELLAGESISVHDLFWSTELAPSGVERFGFRTLGPIHADDFQVDYLNASGNRLSTGTPACHVTTDDDGLTVVVLELTGPADCHSARISASSKARPQRIFGPVARESYRSAGRSKLLGRQQVVALPDGTGSIKLRSLLVSGQGSTPAHVGLRFYDQAGNELMGPADASVSPVHGAYLTLSSGTSTGWAETSLRLPEGTRSVAVTPFKSRIEAAVSAHLSLSVRDASADSLTSFLSELSATTPLILIDSTAPPLGYGLITIRPNNLTMQYSAMGYGVISVGYGTLQGKDRRPLPLVYQAPRVEFRQVIAKVADEARHRPCLYVCSSFPSPQAVATLDTLGSHGWRTLYEIRDDMEEFKRVGYSQWYTVESETLICQRADYITAVSPALSAKAKTLSGGRAEPVTIPNAIHEHYIEKAAPLRTLQVVEAKRRSGIVGYVGHLTEAWFDWDLFLGCAERLTRTRFEIIGMGLPENIDLPGNVFFHGPKKQQELQDITQAWAVGLIPFKKSPLTRGVDPNKLFEYCAWGLRTVSAAMGSIDECPTARSYNTFDEMLSALKDALNRPWTQHELDHAEVYLRAATWRNRAERTLEVVGL